MSSVRRSFRNVAVDSQLLGVSRRRTPVGLAYLVCIAALTATSTTVARATVSGTPLETQLPGVDTLYWATIVLVVLSTFVVPIAYALYNGGPVLAALIAVCPELVVYVTTGTLHLTPDVVVGITLGALAAALALYGASYRLRGSLAPGALPELENSLLFATAAAVVAVVAVGRLYVEGPAAMATRTEPYSAGVIPTVALIGHGWLTFRRT